MEKVTEPAFIARRHAPSGSEEGAQAHRHKVVDVADRVSRREYTAAVRGSAGPSSGVEVSSVSQSVSYFTVPPRAHPETVYPVQYAGPVSSGVEMKTLPVSLRCFKSSQVQISMAAAPAAFGAPAGARDREGAARRNWHGWIALSRGFIHIVLFLTRT